MALQGSIKDFGLPDIFQLIGLQRKTGNLTLKTGKDQVVTVVFEGGMVVSADSGSKRMEDRLGNVLVKQGKITKEQLDDALTTQKATLQRLGHVLVTQNHITSEDLRQALMVQVSQLVFRVFRWRDGDYHFEPVETVDFDRDNFQPMSADFILMEGIRMVDEWPIIEKKIPSMDIVMRPAVDPNAVELASDDDGHHADKAAASSKIRLSRDEEKVFRKVDGTRTVQGVIDATGLVEFEVCRILFDLLNRNLIAIGGKGQTQSAEAREQAVASPAIGYAVLAIAVLLALAGIAVQHASPFGVAGTAPYLRAPLHQLLENVNQQRLERLDRAVMAFAQARGVLPENLGELAQLKLVDRGSLLDPWARDYQYAKDSTNTYVIQAVDAGGVTIGTPVRRTMPPPAP